MASAPAVRRSFAALLRAARASFAGDAPALAASRAEARKVFRANAGVTDAERIRKLVADAHDAAGFLEESVVQARLNDRGVYGAWGLHPFARSHVAASTSADPLSRSRRSYLVPFRNESKAAARHASPSGRPCGIVRKHLRLCEHSQYCGLRWL